MPWKNSIPLERRLALIGKKPFVKSLYKESYNVGEKKFMEEVTTQKKSSAFFKEIDNSDPSDWLLNHRETGQTFEQFWESVTMSGDSGIKSTITFNSTKHNKNLHRRPKNIYILPLGAFPCRVRDFVTRENENCYKENQNPFFKWLKTYCEVFFFSTNVKLLPPIAIRDVNCQFRVNDFTGRYQLNATDILTYLRKVKPHNAHCLIAVTMIDLYPRDSWNFVFGLASTSKCGVGGVGVFSFSRYDERFYESWTLNGDKISYLEDGTPDYSIFDKPPTSLDGGSPVIDGPLLYRACKVMTHELGHMFGLKHCIWMQCLMNGSNHLQESDRRPSHLCPVCLRKLQSVLNFSILERYQAIRDWMSGKTRHQGRRPMALSIKLDAVKKFGITPSATSTTSAEAFMKSTISSKRRQNKPWVPKHTLFSHKPTQNRKIVIRNKASQRPVSAPASSRPSTAAENLCNNVIAPLEEFQLQKSWLDDAIEFIASNGKPGNMSKLRRSSLFIHFGFSNKNFSTRHRD